MRRSGARGFWPKRSVPDNSHQQTCGAASSPLRRCCAVFFYGCKRLRDVSSPLLVHPAVVVLPILAKTP